MNTTIALLLGILAVVILILIGIVSLIKKVDYIIRHFGLIMRSQ